MQDKLDQICEIVDRHAIAARQSSALQRVALYKQEAAPQPVSGVYGPMMALILRGAKEISIGDRFLRYDPASYFIAMVELPASGCTRLDQPDEAYLAVSLDLEADVLAQLLPEAVDSSDDCEAAFAVMPVTPELLDAWLRLLRLLDNRATSRSSLRFASGRSSIACSKVARAPCCARSPGPTAACRGCAAPSP